MTPTPVWWTRRSVGSPISVASASYPACQHRPHAVAAGLLLDHRGEEDVARPARRRRLSSASTADEVGGDPRLHVAGAATPDLPVVHLAAPRVVRPALRRLDGHDVDVAVQMQRAAAAGSSQPAGDAGAALVGQDREAGPRVVPPPRRRPAGSARQRSRAAAAAPRRSAARLPPSPSSDPLADEARREVDEIVEPFVDGTCDRVEHGRE